MGDYEIWQNNWSKLAINSQLNTDCLLIKLRESLVGQAAEYIGKTGMSILSYDQIWQKLSLRYAVPWLKTQQAARRLMEIEPPTNNDTSIIKYVDAIREAVDTAERVDMRIEHLFFNICIDNLPIE